MTFEETDEDKQYWNNLYKRLTKHAASQVDWTADHSDEPYGLNSDLGEEEDKIEDTKSYDVDELLTIIKAMRIDDDEEYDIGYNTALNNVEEVINELVRRNNHV